MRIRPRLLLLLCLAILAGPAALAHDIPAEVRAGVPDAQLVGQGTMRYMLWDVYQALLYAPNGHQSFDAAFAVELDYKRTVSKARVMDATLDQLSSQGLASEAQIQDWRGDMNRVLRGAQDGSVLVGLYRADGSSCFFKDGQATGCVADPAFGWAFFGIWLSPRTSEPELRRQLLGGQG